MDPSHDPSRQENLDCNGGETENKAVVSDRSEDSENQASHNIPDEVQAEAAEARPVSSPCPKVEDCLTETGSDGLILDEQDFWVGAIIFIRRLGGGSVGGRVDGLDGIDRYVCSGLWRLDHAQGRNEFAVGVADLRAC